MSNIDWSLLITKDMKEAEAAKLVAEQHALIEEDWRSEELVVVARQLEAIEEAEADEPPADLLSGTRKQWLKYRGQVSNWKAGAQFFPDQSHRPARPA
jgi:hypothetical protein